MRAEIVECRRPSGGTGNEQSGTDAPGRRDDVGHVGPGKPRSPSVDRGAQDTGEGVGVLRAGHAGIDAVGEHLVERTIRRRQDRAQGTLRTEGSHQLARDGVPRLHDHGPRDPGCGLHRI